MLMDVNAYVGRRETAQSDRITNDNGVSPISSIHTMDYDLVDGKFNLDFRSGKWSASAGLEYSYTSTRQVQRSENSPADNRSENNQYHNLYALYATAMYTLSSHWTVNAGIRGELSSNHYSYDGESQPESGSDFYLTPNLGVNYYGGGVYASLTYSSNLYRPVYYFLTTGFSSLSPTLWQTGNPFLKEDHENQFQFSLSWKKSYFYILYGLGKNRCDYGLSYDPEMEVSIMNPVSVPKMQNVAIVLQQRMNIGVWNPTFTGILLMQHLRFGDLNEKFEKPYLRIQWQNYFSLPWRLQAYANLYYSTNGHTNLYRAHQTFSGDIILCRTFGPVSVDIYANNILNTSKLAYTLSMNGVKYVTDRKACGPSFQLSVTYNFKSSKANYKGGHKSSDLNRL